MDSLLQVLMRRDEMTRAEALEEIRDIKKRIREGEDPEEILHEEYGLEPDYVMDLI
jgi:hypothetical protein